jgi:hypothetical protein
VIWQIFILTFRITKKHLHNLQAWIWQLAINNLILKCGFILILYHIVFPGELCNENCELYLPLFHSPSTQYQHWNKSLQEYHLSLNMLAC